MLGIIFNPKSGRRALKKQRQYITNLLNQQQIDYAFVESKYAGHCIEIAQSLVENGYDQLLVLGGDGTMSEIVDGVMHANITPEQRKNLRIGLIPSGTGNDWARYWNLASNYKHAIDVFFNSGEVRQVDVGCLSLWRCGKEEKHYFINSIGFGIDALSCVKAHTLRYYIGSFGLNYLFGLLWALCSHRPTPVILQLSDGQTITKPLYTMNIANGPYSGGGIKQNPDANPCDGLFHAMIAEQPTLRQICKAVFQLFNGKLTNAEFIQNIVSDKITIRTNAVLPIEKDGLIIDACAPYQVTLIKSAFGFVVPKIY